MNRIYVYLSSKQNTSLRAMTGLLEDIRDSEHSKYSEESTCTALVIN